MKAGRVVLALGALGMAPVLMLSLVVFLAFSGGGKANAAGANVCTATKVDGQGQPVEVAGYSGAAIANAAIIIEEGLKLGLSERDVTIGVMTAMGESQLQILDYGDQAGPDSRGLFQQRGNGAWGSYADRMDPHISSHNFFVALARIDSSERATWEPSMVAHTVQVNADPFYYRPYWPRAEAMFAALRGGVSVSCASSLNPGHVVNPSVSTKISSPFGARCLANGDCTTHDGLDFDAACNSDIFAFRDGTVAAAGWLGTGQYAAGAVWIAHGDGQRSLYLHMDPANIFVKPGDKVVAGQRIALVGNTGYSFGCHLHFTVEQDGVRVDPAPILIGAGIALEGV